MSTLTELRDRVAALQGPDREVDALAWCWANNSPFIRMLNNERFKHHHREYPAVTMQHGHTFSNAERYTASVDAVLSLIERTLPAPETWAAGSPPSSGWKISLYRGMTPTGAPYASWHAMIRRHAEAEKDCIAPTPALALLLALLEAKSSGETS